MIRIQLFLIAVLFLIHFGCNTDDSNLGNVANDFSSLIPIMDMSALETYYSEDGGLYGMGSNDPSSEHISAAQNILNEIFPRGSNGDSSSSGKIGFISIGMSNTSTEFKSFIGLAEADPDITAMLKIINGAQVGMTAEDWAMSDEPWTVLTQRLETEGLTNSQIQVAWTKLALAYPTTGWSESAETLKSDLIIIAKRLHQYFPNLKVVYLSSRIYAGYALTDKNPEPYAYESGFAVRWAIQEQINGSSELNFDPAKGDVIAPLLLWGPYLWANATTPRSDGLVWNLTDFEADGTHPNEQGQLKVANILLNFFKNNLLTKTWFLK